MQLSFLKSFSSPIIFLFLILLIIISITDKLRKQNRNYWWNNNCRRQGDAPKKSRYPIFVTLSLAGWMFASRLAFNPRSKATNIGYLLFLGAVLWLGIELLFHVEVLWRIARKVWFSIWLFSEAWRLNYCYNIAKICCSYWILHSYRGI